MNNQRLNPIRIRTTRFFVMLFLLSTLSIFNSCKKDAFIDPVTNDIYLKSRTDDDREILEGLNKAGFSADDIAFQDDFVAYQDDAGWDKAALLHSLRFPDVTENMSGSLLFAREDTGTAGYRQQGIEPSKYLDAVKAAKISALKYYIRSSISSDCNPDWQDAIVKAMTIWNEEPYSRVTLIRTYDLASANIVFGSDKDELMPVSHQNLSSATVAKSGFPAAGLPWKWISVNHTQANYESKIKIILHQLGHCIGFLHTDSTEGCLIYNTPTIDPNSVMNQEGIGSPVFSTGDSRAIRLYYPNALSKPTSVTVDKFSDTEVVIKYENIALDQAPYYWLKCKVYSNTGVVIASCFVAAETGSDGFNGIKLGNLTPGQLYKISLQGYNFRRDIGSPESAKVELQM